MSPPAKRMKSTKRITSIEDLPLEMISELFEHLHLKDLAACSLVNKRWHSIYAAFKVHRLVTSDNRYDYGRQKWFHSNLPIQKAERCCLAMLFRLAEKPLLSNLKQLALDVQTFDLNKLNHFQQLVHLEIGIVFSSEVTVKLNFPELKVLALRGWDDLHPLSIDCPKLNTLLYDGDFKEGASLFKVKQPETIRKLEMGIFGPPLAPFKNVECLVTKKWSAISKATLLSLPRLRELHYNRDIGGIVDEFHGVGAVDRVKRRLREFLNDIKQLRSRHFRFTFSGFQLTKTMLDQIDFCVEILEGDEEEEEWVHSEHVFMKNYHLIEPGALHFVSSIDYSLLLKRVTGEFPRCFTEKLTDIELVETGEKVQDPDHFLWFLKSLRSLRSLELNDTELSQEFYNQLPESACSLSRLFLRGRYCENELQLNFDFIGRLSLSYLDAVLSLQSLPSLVRWLGGLKNGRFGVLSKEESFWIWKETDSTEWKVYGPDQMEFKAENPENILNFFDGLQG